MAVAEDRMPPLIFRIWADDYSARKSNTLQETSLLGGRLGQLGYLGSQVGRAGI